MNRTLAPAIAAHRQQSPHKHVRSRQPLRAALIAASVSIALGACSEQDPNPPLSPLDAVFSPTGRAENTPCIEGTVETCSLTLGEHDGVLSCYEGSRLCENGLFGPCGDGHEFEVRREELTRPGAFGSTRPGAGSTHTLALSLASACISNPCNRYCREFNEVPPDGLLPNPDLMSPALTNWNTGDLASYPLGVPELGEREPCQVAQDCQFNQVCQDPAPASCEHDVCTAGDALLTGCSQCSDAVCALEPSCCGVTSSCAHDPCVSGNALVAGCDQCVAVVCGSHPECCSGSWDATCVGYVATECQPFGQACGCPAGSIAVNGTCYELGDPPLSHAGARTACAARGPGWDLIQIDDFNENAIAAGLLETSNAIGAWLGASVPGPVADEWIWQRDNQVFFVNDAPAGSLQSPYTYSNWASGEPELGALDRAALISNNGRWSDEDPALAFDYLCEGPGIELSPKRPTEQWTASCVARVAQACGAECPSGNAAGYGACAPRVASRLDATCPGFDLSLGATCADAGVPQVPVCNHGQAPAPAGLTIYHVAAGQIRSVNPNLTGAETCTLTEAVPPGRCVVVTSCPNLSAGRELIVNPAPGGDATECRRDDNWTIYEPVTCGNPLCEASVHDSQRLDLPDNCSVDVASPTTIDPSTARVVLDTGAAKPSCEADEIHWAGSCYFVSSEPATWDTARQRCQGRGPGWDMIALNFLIENVMARDMVGDFEEVQIGFNDKDVEGVHEWSNGSCVGWENWRDDPPDVQPNDPGGQQQCVRMTSEGSLYNWEDKSCLVDEARYICEGPVNDAQGSCQSGQFEGPNGDCYEFVPGAMTYADARSACQTRGTGWDLAVIQNYDTTDFLVSHSSCSRAWIGTPPPGFDDWDFGEPDNLATNCPSTGPRGFWRDEDCSDTYGALCQGPPTVLSGEVLSPVANAAACTTDDQYYFAASFAPDSLTLCPDACTRARASSVPLRVDIACTDAPVRAQETQYSELYEADCDGEPQWDFLLYDTVTPGDSSVTFEARSAPSAAELSGPFVTLATAHAVPADTQRCEISPPACPVNLFSLLESPGFRLNVLELKMTLQPGTNGEGPMVRDWKVQYSCPPSE